MSSLLRGYSSTINSTVVVLDSLRELKTEIPGTSVLSVCRSLRKIDRNVGVAIYAAIYMQVTV